VNKYEKAFVEHIYRLKIKDGPTFTKLVTEALEAEYGGQVSSLWSDLSQQSVEDPEKFAAALYKALGTDEAMKYYATIIKYAESGRFQPEEDAELQQEEEKLASVIRETESDSEPEPEFEPWEQ
jgi:hypothetical protein